MSKTTTIQSVGPAVDSEEWLSRYIFTRSHIRQDNTLKADPFIPHPYLDLSITRHLGLDDKQLWAIGEDIAKLREKPLLGRADNQAALYLDRTLKVDSDPVPGNPNHAVVTGWPADKPSQKIIALEIAAGSRFVPR